MERKNLDLTTFTKSIEGMVKKNTSAWNDFLQRHSSIVRSEYSLEEVQRIIASGDILMQQRLSRAFYDRNGLYKRILIHYATVLKYVGMLIPHPSFGKKLSTSFIQKRYFSALEYLDSLHLPELLTRISLNALIYGCYYGLIDVMDKSGFKVIDLPATYCRSKFRDLLGNDIVEFNVEYFYTFLDLEERKDILKSYPKVIASYYRKYRDGKVTSPWVMLPAEITVCFPFFDDGHPLFLDVIPATIEYEDAIDTDRERDLEEIRKIIVQKIPHLNDGLLLFEPDEAEIMHKGAVEMLSGNKNVSVLTTYADVDAIVSKTTSDNVNNSVEKMLQNVYSEAGASAQLFAPTSSQALNTSITNDMALMMILGNKYSRFISFILNHVFSNSNVTFSYEILPVTWYNQSDYIIDAFKLSQSGYSFLVPSIALGINQRDLIDVKALENDVLKLTEVLIPLSSAYTQSAKDGGDNAGGAPEKSVEEKAETTVQEEESAERTETKTTTITEGGSN